MAEISSINHPVIGLIAWEPEKPAERINDHILMSRSTSHAYLITSPAGDVLINSGTPYQGTRTRERFEQLLGRKLKLASIIFTQSHPDHIGGWAAFADAGVKTIVQREFPRISDERKLLGPYFAPRAANVLLSMLPKKEHRDAWYTGTRDPDNLTLFGDSHGFTLGGRTFELLSVPSGETLDSLAVWLPKEKTLFIGNWAGAIYGALPNFYTARGDRQRSVPTWLKELDMLLALKPELLITGHGEPVAGNAQIAKDLGKLGAAVRYIHDATVQGMNAYKTLHTLMQEIKLPPELTPNPGRCPVAWIVRAVFEEYTGWFRQESATELYAVPPRAIWAELATLAGGAAVLAARAQAHIAEGELVEALHFTDIAKAAEPNNAEVLAAELKALELLVQANGGKTFDELGYLENEIRQVKAKLS